MPSLALEPECRSDQQIAADVLSYLQSDSSDRVAYEVEPTRLTGGFDARLYRYKLVGQEFPLQVYSIDMSRQRRWDISQPYVYDIMMEAMEEGLVDVLLSGPPCSTSCRTSVMPCGSVCVLRRTSGRYSPVITDFSQARLLRSIRPL